MRTTCNPAESFAPFFVRARSCQRLERYVRYGPAIPGWPLGLGGLTCALAYSNSPPIGANTIPMAKKRGSTVLGVRIGLPGVSKGCVRGEERGDRRGWYSLPCFQPLLSECRIVSETSASAVRRGPSRRLRTVRRGPSPLTAKGNPKRFRGEIGAAYWLASCASSSPTVCGLPRST